MRRLLLIILVLTVHSPSLFANPEDVAYCRSKDVWDAGFFMSFDLSAKAGNETVLIPAVIYELVPLWQRRPVYSGQLVLADEPQACEFVLEDYTAAPTVVIHFKITGTEDDIQLQELNGRKPDQWTKLECQPQLIDRLARGCK